MRFRPLGSEPARRGLKARLRPARLAYVDGRVPENRLSQTTIVVLLGAAVVRVTGSEPVRLFCPKLTCVALSKPTEGVGKFVQV